MAEPPSIFPEDFCVFELGNFPGPVSASPCLRASFLSLQRGRPALLAHCSWLEVLVHNTLPWAALSRRLQGIRLEMPQCPASRYVGGKCDSGAQVLFHVLECPSRIGSCWLTNSSFLVCLPSLGHFSFLTKVPQFTQIKNQPLNPVLGICF